VLWLEDGQFKEARTMAIDPVCGMSIERESAVATLGHEGTTYYFCAQGCREEFAQEPTRYLAASPIAPHARD